MCFTPSICFIGEKRTNLYETLMQTNTIQTHTISEFFLRIKTKYANEKYTINLKV